MLDHPAAARNTRKTSVKIQKKPATLESFLDPIFLAFYRYVSFLLIGKLAVVIRKLVEFCYILSYQKECRFTNFFLGNLRIVKHTKI